MARNEQGLTAADRLLAPAVAEMLGALELAPEDVAAAKLAGAYARELDGAAAVAAQAARVLRDAASSDDADLVEQVRALANQLSARAALANIGPKLHALLADLGATPKGRAGLKKGAGAPSGGGKLAALRGGRAG